MSISESYGGYGGVGRNTKYSPPASPDFVPQPSLLPPKSKYIPAPVPDFIPHPPTMPFTSGIREDLKVITGANSPFFNLNDILFRTRTDSLTGVTDRTFAMTTSGDPQHVITYTMPASSTALDMRISDGGYF